MAGTLLLTVGLVGFGAAIVSLAGVLLLVLAAHPGTRQAHALVAALLVSLAWAVATTYALWTQGTALVWLPKLDVLRVGAWVLFTASILGSRGSARSARRVATAVVALGILCVVPVLLMQPRGEVGGIELNGQVLLVALLILPLLGLLALEQVARNADLGERRVVRPLVSGIGLILVLEVFCHSQLFIFSDVSSVTWQLRGFGSAIAAPLILMAIKRQQEWERELFLSRHVVFHTTSLVAAGVYLLVLGTAGSMIGSFDGTPRAVLEVTLLVVASAVFLYVLFSSVAHRRLKVFIAKHFYRNNYDYRQEWLRLIATLAGTSDDLSVSERGVKALAEIIEAPRGELWWADDLGLPFHGCGSWGMPAPDSTHSRDSALVRFLETSHWVIDTDEYTRNPGHYEFAFESDQHILNPPSIYVPLILDGSLRGVVRLDRRPDLGHLSFEDHDLLKTAGKQVAVFLAQERVQARLAETRQFEAFSRLATFLMHDLKNMISQQELVVVNAARFKHKPEFVDDAIRTIEASVKRMRKVLERLQSHGRDDSASTVDLGKLLAEVVNACSDRRPEPVLRSFPADAYVAVNKDRLAMALTHAIRNAQEATKSDGSIDLHVDVAGKVAVVEVVDTGHGMTEEFIRSRLFRPFDSTKGAQGMGIGAYQVRETIRAAGGDVEVRSVPGAGTTMRLCLPLVESLSRLNREASSA